MKLYGIPTCGTVRNARKFFKDNDIEVEFVDFKKVSVGCQELDYWLKHEDIDTLFNSRGTKYKTLKLKDLNLDAAAKREWLCKENMLYKRPIVEYKDSVVVGWDEAKYRDIFLNK